MKLKDLVKNPRGLGDTVNVVTKVTGIEKVVKETTKALGKEDCGCGKRQDKLNEMFPYKRKEQ
jgi:hypothetical protein